MHDPGDFLGAVASGLCVLAAAYLVGLLCALFPEAPRRQHLRRLLTVSLAAAALATAISYVANVTWS